MQPQLPRLVRVLQICQSYKIPGAHRPALPYTSTGASVPTATCQPGASVEAWPLHIQPAQLRFWASCSHSYQVLSQVWLCRHSTVGAVQWGRLCLSLPHPKAAQGIVQGSSCWQTLTLGSWQAPKGICTGFYISHSTLRGNKCTLQYCTHRWICFLEESNVSWILTTNIATEMTSHFPLEALLNWGALFVIQAAGKASACPSVAVEYFMPTDTV